MTVPLLAEEPALEGFLADTFSVTDWLPALAGPVGVGALLAAATAALEAPAKVFGFV